MKWQIISSQSAIVPGGAFFSIGVLYYIKGVLHVRYLGGKEKLHWVTYSPVSLVRVYEVLYGGQRTKLN